MNHTKAECPFPASYSHFWHFLFRPPPFLTQIDCLSELWIAKNEIVNHINSIVKTPTNLLKIGEIRPEILKELIEFAWKMNNKSIGKNNENGKRKREQRVLPFYKYFMSREKKHKNASESEKDKEVQRNKIEIDKIKFRFDDVTQNYHHAKHSRYEEMYSPLLGTFRELPYYTSLAPSLCIPRR